MGWADCGMDSKGRPIGYAHEAKCDEDGCDEQIDRGLSYACGGEHGETKFGCEKYFCGAHLFSYHMAYRYLATLCKGCLEIVRDA